MRYTALIAILGLLTVGSFPAVADDVVALAIAKDSANIVAASTFPGTCKTVCSGLILVTWSAFSYNECCQGSANVCPQGSTPIRASYTPYGGYTVKCGNLG